MERDRDENGGIEALSGSVYGVDLRGRLPAAFRPYLSPRRLGRVEEHARERTATTVDVSYRRVAEPPEVSGDWSSEVEGPHGTVRLALFDVPRGFGLAVGGLDRGRGGGSFRCTRRAIRITWSAPASEASHALFAQALPLWLEWEGVPVLHGSAVTVEGRTIAFLGRSGVGKSLLCAELLRAGCGFVSDDGVALRRDRRGHWICPPGPPFLRLWPSGLEGRLGIDPATLPKVQRSLEKRRLPPEAEASSPRPDERPLRAIYLLRRRPETGGSVEISACRPRDALARLIEHGVAVGPAAALGLSARRLRLLADVVEAVPVRVLRYPSGAGTAARIREALDRDR